MLDRKNNSYAEFSPRNDPAASRAPALLNANEAVAWAALAADVDYFSHYPGSPVNMVEPALKKAAASLNANIVFNDALNEHIAALSAAGASLCGARAMVVMKHVGMNIAADPFNYIGLTGVKGGMVIIVGTDPGANSSTGEEDTHWYAVQSSFPLFEPTSVRETFTLVQEAFDVSERYELPVLVFLPGRLCYNSDYIDLPEIKRQDRAPEFYFNKDPRRYINVGQRAVRNHRKLLSRLERFSEEVLRSRTFYNPDASVGLVTRGLTFGHTFEAAQRLGVENQVHLLNCDLVFPLHGDTIKNFFKDKSEVFVIEDQDGFLESRIKMRFFNDIECRVYGKEYFPKYGEIGYNQVETFLAGLFGVHRQDTLQKQREKAAAPAAAVPERLGTFCEGCPHRGAFYAIEKALDGTDGVIGGDIGCSSLPPFRADWLLCMNAGIGVSQGMAQVLKQQPVISTGGDGSFFHAGLIALQSAVQNNIDLIHVVFDNGTVAMTGHQASPSTGDGFEHRQLLRAIGVERIIDVSAFKPETFAALLKHELGQKGVRVFWVKGRCAQLPSPFRRFIRTVRKIEIDVGKCGTCQICHETLSCPAIRVAGSKHEPAFPHVDADRCMRCGACMDVCPKNAIHSVFSCSLLSVAGHFRDFVETR